MEKQELIEKLKKLRTTDDIEASHSDADDLLLKYINDTDISNAYEEVPKWYA